MTCGRQKQWLLIYGRVVIPLIFPNLPQCSPTESSGFPRNARNALGHPGTRKRRLHFGSWSYPWWHQTIDLAPPSHSSCKNTHGAPGRTKKRKNGLENPQKIMGVFWMCFFVCHPFLEKIRCQMGSLSPIFWGVKTSKIKIMFETTS